MKNEKLLELSFYENWDFDMNVRKGWTSFLYPFILFAGTLASIVMYPVMVPYWLYKEYSLNHGKARCGE